MRPVRRAGEEQDVRGTLQQPGRRDRHRSRPQASGDRRERGGLQRGETAEGEERHIGDAFGGEPVDQIVVVAVSKLYKFCTQTIGVMLCACAVCEVRNPPTGITCDL